MASSVTVQIVNIRVNTVNLGFASGNSIFLMLTICTVTLEAVIYLYNITTSSVLYSSYTNQVIMITASQSYFYNP